ncbi:hypothetical protein [Pseudomonas amygdali]|nr:hypothetical protein PLA107_032470 [Pseudomonas amygdali pv. lachrymans str. M301315]
MEVSKTPYLNGVDVEGRSVRLIPEKSLPLQYRLALASQQGGGAMKFDLGDQSYCSVLVQGSTTEGMVNRYYIMRSHEDSENTFVDSRLNEFYLAAHELSHCFNNSSGKSVDQLVKIYRDKAYTGYAEPISMLEVSMRETYADLAAVMLGASKTGDWTVFTDAVMPYRTGQPDTTHLTINALSSILSGVDPRMVKGMSFNEVNVLVNDLFQANFMNADKQIDLNSLGARRIAQEMEYSGERLRLYARIKGVDKDEAEAMITKANLMRGFTRQLYGKTLGNSTDYAFLSALQIVDAQSQQALASNTQLTNTSEGWILSGVKNGSEYREREARVFYQEMSKGILNGVSLDRQVSIVSTWKSQVSSEISASMITDSLDTLIAQGTVPGVDPTQDSVRDAVAQSIQKKLTVLRAGIVSAAASPSAKISLRETSTPGLD